MLTHNNQTLKRMWLTKEQTAQIIRDGEREAAERPLMEELTRLRDKCKKLAIAGDAMCSALQELHPRTCRKLIDQWQEAKR